MSANLGGVGCRKPEARSQMTEMLIMHTKVMLFELSPLSHSQVIAARNPGPIKIVAFHLTFSGGATRGIFLISSISVSWF
jgi:hypothetical protein